MFTKALKLVTPDSGGAITTSTSCHGRDRRSEDEEVFLDAQEAQLHPDAHPDGGLGCSDLQLLERQRSAILEVVKTLGKNLITGMLVRFYRILCCVSSSLLSDLIGGLFYVHCPASVLSAPSFAHLTPLRFYFKQATLIS